MLGHGGGQVVSILTCHSDDLSSNPADQRVTIKRFRCLGRISIVCLWNEPLDFLSAMTQNFSFSSRTCQTQNDLINVKAFLPPLPLIGGFTQVLGTFLILQEPFLAFFQGLNLINFCKATVA